MVRSLKVLGVILVLSLVGCGKNPAGPSGPNPSPETVQIDDLVIGVPRGATVGERGLPMTFWLNTKDLPDGEFVTFHYCLSKRRDILTHGCGHYEIHDVATIKKMNPLKGFAIPSEWLPGTYNFVLILVFQGQRNGGIYSGERVPTDTIGRAIVEWEVDFAPFGPTS